MLNTIPKLATILFHELHKTVRSQDPYENFEENILPIVERNILFDLFQLGEVSAYLDPGSRHVAAMKLFWKFYRKTGAYESDFVLEFAWLVGGGEKYIPDIFAQLFQTMNLSLPIPQTSTRFEARSVTTLDTHGDNTTIDGSVFTLVFHKEYKERVRQSQNWWIDENTRYLPMSRLLVCKRVSLSLSEFTKSAGDLYHPSGIAITLPDDYIMTDTAIEICADDYFDKATTIMTMPGHGVTDTYLHDFVVILSFACSCLSIICLLITVVTYLFLKPLRTLPGKINLCLCLSLLLAQTLQQFTMDWVKYRTVCIICGVFIHFMWSASLLWMNVSSFNLFLCFSTANLGRNGFQPSLALYTFYVNCTSSLFVAINMAYTFLRYGFIGYGENLCYISTKMGLLITFVIPVGVIVLANLCFLSVTIWRISHAPKLDGSKSVDRNNVLIYIKMSTLTGTCWIFGFLRILTEVEVFEVLFIVANASQGLFIMISFICNRRVMDLFKEFLPKSCTRRTEAQD